jgi:hypothetical protein
VEAVKLGGRLGSVVELHVRRRIRKLRLTVSNWHWSDNVPEKKRSD